MKIQNFMNLKGESPENNDEPLVKNGPEKKGGKHQEDAEIL